MAKSLKKPNSLKFTEGAQGDNQNLETFTEESAFLAEEKSIGFSELEALKINQQQEILDGLKQDRGERKKYARWVFLLIIGWLISDLVVVFFVGLQIIKLSDAVLITLITTTTGSVIAIFLYVMVYLFKGTLPIKKSTDKKPSLRKNK